MFQDGIKEVASAHAAFSGSSPSKTTHAIQQTITSSVTDRVEVNKSVGRELVERGLVNEDFVQLFCNVHPLDSLSHKAREALKELKTPSHSKGLNCVAKLYYSFSCRVDVKKKKPSI